MGPIAESIAETMAAADRALAEVRRGVWDEGGDLPHGYGRGEELERYVEALEAKVREQAMALRIAGVTVARDNEGVRMTGAGTTAFVPDPGAHERG